MYFGLSGAHDVSGSASKVELMVSPPRETRFGLFFHFGLGWKSLEMGESSLSKSPAASQSQIELLSCSERGL